MQWSELDPVGELRKERGRRRGVVSVRGGERGCEEEERRGLVTGGERGCEEEERRKGGGWSGEHGRGEEGVKRKG